MTRTWGAGGGGQGGEEVSVEVEGEEEVVVVEDPHDLDYNRSQLAIAALGRPSLAASDSCGGAPLPLSTLLCPLLRAPSRSDLATPCHEKEKGGVGEKKSE